MTRATDPRVIAEFAPAKVNLALHVTGLREDGYHLLDSLVVFPPVGDRLEVQEAGEFSLSVVGPFASGVPDDNTNLVWKAAEALAPGRGARITLEKNLPPASGVGGGSSDAAAALRALSVLWGVPLSPPETYATLGADVPVCLLRQTSRMRGIGQSLTPLNDLPATNLLLVNPRIEVSTLDVFALLAKRKNPPLPELPPMSKPEDLARYVASCRNDLQPAAMSLAPDIGEVLAAIRATGGCLLARMSGSGATCFGLYSDEASRNAAREQLERERRDWWVAA